MRRLKKVAMFLFTFIKTIEQMLNKQKKNYVNLPTKFACRLTNKRTIGRMVSEHMTACYFNVIKLRSAKVELSCCWNNIAITLSSASWWHCGMAFDFRNNQLTNGRFIDDSQLATNLCKNNKPKNPEYLKVSTLTSKLQECRQSTLVLFSQNSKPNNQLSLSLRIVYSCVIYHFVYSVRLFLFIYFFLVDYFRM